MLEKKQKYLPIITSNALDNCYRCLYSMRGNHRIAVRIYGDFAVIGEHVPVFTATRYAAAGIQYFVPAPGDDVWDGKAQIPFYTLGAQRRRVHVPYVVSQHVDRFGIIHNRFSIPLPRAHDKIRKRTWRRKHCGSLRPTPEKTNVLLLNSIARILNRNGMRP